MKILYLIPARAGSKGLPGKNTKILGDKPLVSYSIEFALNNMNVGDELCISSDDKDVLDIASAMGVKVPFERPEELSTDTSTTHDVIMHALNYYENHNTFFDAILLLQPTSPFRSKEDLANLLNSYSSEIDMAVSVKLSKENPYFTLFEENKDGYLDKSKNGNFTRRQDAPLIYAFNGSLYLINVASLKAGPTGGFTKIKKVVMPEERSIDIDTIADWKLAEFYLNEYH